MTFMSRLRAAASYVVRGANPALTGVYWPGYSGGGGNGDRGPPGSWQMNLGDPVDMESLGFSAVYSCINIISSDIAKLGWTLRRLREDGGHESGRNSPYHAVLKKPNAYQTETDFIQQLIANTLFTGNGIVLKWPDERGIVREMHNLDPRRVRPVVTEQGELFYTFNKNPIFNLNEDNPKWVAGIPAKFIIHHRLMTLNNALWGMSPLYAAAVSMSTGIAIQANQREFFANMSRAGGVLTSPNKIDPAVAKRLKNDWEENFSRGQLGRTAVMGDGLKWEAMTINAVDAQLIEQMKLTGSDVANVYRVPSFLMGDMTKATYKNSEQMQRAYYSGCLQYHIESLEDRFQLGLNLPNDLEIEFEIENMLRTEIDVRYGAYQKGLGAGWLTINEVRAEEGFSPVAGGNEPMVQMQYIPLSEAVKPKPKPEPVPAPTDEEEEDPDKDPDEDEDEEDADEPPKEDAAPVPARKPKRHKGIRGVVRMFLRGDKLFAEYTDGKVEQCEVEL